MKKIKEIIQSFKYRKRISYGYRQIDYYNGFEKYYVEYDDGTEPPEFWFHFDIIQKYDDAGRLIAIPEKQKFKIAFEVSEILLKNGSTFIWSSSEVDTSSLPSKENFFNRL